MLFESREHCDRLLSYSLGIGFEFRVLKDYTKFRIGDFILRVVTGIYPDLCLCDRIQTKVYIFAAPMDWGRTSTFQPNHRLNDWPAKVPVAILAQYTIILSSKSVLKYRYSKLVAIALCIQFDSSFCYKFAIFDLRWYNLYVYIL
jgi:hypothetical protein